MSPLGRCLLCMTVTVMIMVLLPDWHWQSLKEPDGLSVVAVVYDRHVVKNPVDHNYAHCSPCMMFYRHIINPLVLVIFIVKFVKYN